MDDDHNEMINRPKNPDKKANLTDIDPSRESLDLFGRSNEGTAFNKLELDDQEKRHDDLLEDISPSYIEIAPHQLPDEISASTGQHDLKNRPLIPKENIISTTDINDANTDSSISSNLDKNSADMIANMNYGLIRLSMTTKTTEKTRSILADCLSTAMPNAILFKKSIDEILPLVAWKRQDQNLSILTKNLNEYKNKGLLKKVSHSNNWDVLDVTGIKAYSEWLDENQMTTSLSIPMAGEHNQLILIGSIPKTVHKHQGIRETIYNVIIQATKSIS